MKTASILLMLLTILIIFGFGVFYLLGFAMSFDAPGSSSDPKAWGMRFLMFLPILIFIVLLVISFYSYLKGNYRLSVILGAISPTLCVMMLVLLNVASYSSLAKFKKKMAEDKEAERLYPVQKYLRPVEGGADTVIVFPNRIVSYRLYQGPNQYPWGGPLGDLNETRDTILYIISSDTKLSVGELDQFTDENGRALTSIYKIKPVLHQMNQQVY